MADINTARAHLNEALRIMTLEAYRSRDGERWAPQTHMCAIAVELERVDSAIGPRGESMFGRLAQDALAAFTEIEAARVALEETDARTIHNVEQALDQSERAVSGVIGDARSQMLRRLAILYERTTPGPWKPYQDCIHPVEPGGMNTDSCFAICKGFGPFCNSNMQFVAAIHNDWPMISALLAELAPAEWTLPPPPKEQ